MVQLPAVNTPQFDWARTHMARAPRPVAPIVQPEVAAEAIFTAAARPRREIWLDTSTLRVILGNMFLPGVLDRYLGRYAFSAQATMKQVRPYRKDNLMTPVRELHRTRGSFSDEADSSAVAISGPSARVGAGVFALVIAAAVSYATCFALLASRKNKEAKRGAQS